MTILVCFCLFLGLFVRGLSGGPDAARPFEPAPSCTRAASASFSAGASQARAAGSPAAFQRQLQSILFDSQDRSLLVTKARWDSKKTTKENSIRNMGRKSLQHAERHSLLRPSSGEPCQGKAPAHRRRRSTPSTSSPCLAARCGASTCLMSTRRF